MKNGLTVNPKANSLFFFLLTWIVIFLKRKIQNWEIADRRAKNLEVGFWIWGRNGEEECRGDGKWGFAGGGRRKEKSRMWKSDRGNWWSTSLCVSCFWASQCSFHKLERHHQFYLVSFNLSLFSDFACQIWCGNMIFFFLRKIVWMVILNIVIGVFFFWVRCDCIWGFMFSDCFANMLDWLSFDCEIVFTNNGMICLCTYLGEIRYGFYHNFNW